MAAESPPSGPDLLNLLKRPDLARPAPDAELTSLVRRTLEAAAEDAALLSEPVRMTKDAVRRLLLCEANFIAHLGAPDAPSGPMVKGGMADRLFAQVAAGFTIGPDPVSDALSAARAEGDGALVEAWNGLTAEEQQEVRTELEVMAAGLNERWPDLPRSAWPRLQSPIRIELCDGKVILSARVDFAVGKVDDSGTSTVLLDIKAGKKRFDDRDDAYWYALLETLRTGGTPFQVGNYYLATGELDLRPVTVEDLERATSRASDALQRLVRLASGSAPRRNPNPLCPWCPAFSTCEDGRQHASEADVLTEEWLNDEWNDGEEAGDD